MSKTPEELVQLKNEFQTLNNKLKELTESELEIVTGGDTIIHTKQLGSEVPKGTGIDEDPTL